MKQNVVHCFLLSEPSHVIFCVPFESQSQNKMYFFFTSLYSESNVSTMILYFYFISNIWILEQMKCSMDTHKQNRTAYAKAKGIATRELAYVESKLTLNL